MTRRIVLSGLGGVCPRALGRTELWELFPRDGAGPDRPSEQLPPALERVPEALFERLSSPQPRHLDRLGRLLLAAATLALEDSGPETAPVDALQTGIAVGSGYGCLSTNEEYLEGILERGARYGNPVVFQNTVTNAATGAISLVHGLRGPTATLCSGWAAGLEALHFGHQQIEEGQAGRMVVASADSPSPRLFEGMALQGWLSPRGTALPFAADAEGTRVSEAAGALVLEELSRARERGAHLYAEVAGTGHRGGPPEQQAQALTRAVRDALRAAELTPEHLGAVFSGANGHRSFDGWEGQGLRDALGEQASRVPLTCPKAVLGETFSAAGTLAVLLGALALDTGWVPGSGGARRLEREWVLITALSGEGSALAVVLRRCSP